MIPQIAAWGKTMIDGALGAAGTNAAAVGLDKLGSVGILYKGLGTLGGGATLAGIILGAVTVFIIDRQLDKAAAFALAGALSPSSASFTARRSASRSRRSSRSPISAWRRCCSPLPDTPISRRRRRIRSTATASSPRSRRNSSARFRGTIGRSMDRGASLGAPRFCHPPSRITFVAVPSVLASFQPAR